MSDQRQDPDLRERFQAMRGDDAGRSPRFANLLARAQQEIAEGNVSVWRHAHVTWRRAGWAGGVLAAAAIAALIVIPRVRSEEDAFEQAVQAFQTDPALGAWRSPTAGLLELPGSQLMTTIPRVGAGEP